VTIELIVVKCDETELLADLASWLEGGMTKASILPASTSMNAAAIEIMIGGSSAVAQAVLLTIREWVRSRRTTVMVELGPSGPRVHISSSSTSDDLVALAKTVISSSNDE
jgi:hypothetical protein